MSEKKFKVVGKDQAYDGHNIVRMSLRTRKSLKVETGMPVLIKSGKKSAIAIVQKISRRFIGIRNICTLSDNLAQNLEVNVDSIVTLIPKVSDKSYKAYEDAVLAFQRGRVESEIEDEETSEVENEG